MRIQPPDRCPSRPDRPARALALCLSLLILGACSSVPIVGKPAKAREEEQARRVVALLNSYTRDFGYRVSAAAEEIVASTADTAARRASVQWKLDSIPRIKEFNRLENKLEAFLGMWMYTKAMTHYFAEGEGSQVFSEAQPIAIEVSERLGASIDAIAAEVLGPDRVDAARQEVQHFVAEHADFDSIEAAIQEFTATSRGVDWLPSINLAAFNPFGGLNESAAAIRLFSQQTTRVVEDLAEQFPWRIELLLYDVEQRETVRAARVSLDRVSQSTLSMADTAAALPDDVQALITTTLDEIDSKQAGLRQTLNEADQTVRSIESSLVQADQVVAGLTQTAQALTGAGQAWNATFQTLGLGGDGPAGQNGAGKDGDGQDGDGEQPAAPIVDAGQGGAEPEPEGRPFDILDYRDTAVALMDVAVELRGLVGDVGNLTGDQSEGAPLSNLDATVQSAVGGAAGQGRELVDHVTLRAIQVIGVLLLAGILYRLATARLVPRTAARA